LDLRLRIWDCDQAVVSEVCYFVFKGRTELLSRLGLHRSRRNGSTGSYRPEIYQEAKLAILIPRLPNLFTVAQSHPEIAAVLARHGFPPARLTAGAAAVEDLAETIHFRDQATINRTEARLKRDGAFNTLNQWLRCAQRTKADIEPDQRREMENGPAVWLGDSSD
jgi:hypothetical protein